MDKKEKQLYLLANNIWLSVLFLHTFLTFKLMDYCGMNPFSGDLTLIIIFKVAFVIFFVSNLATTVYISQKKVEVCIYHVLDMVKGFLIFALVIVALFLVYSLLHIFFDFKSYEFVKTVQIMMLPLYIPFVMVRIFFPKDR